MSDIRFLETAIPGLFHIQPKSSLDARGTFAKTFVARDYADVGLATNFLEEFHTESVREVVRGMHFQLPPYDPEKVVFCLTGCVFDVVLDLRRGSPTYRKSLTFELEGPTGAGLYVPSGCAHGFCALAERSVLSYRTTAEYAPDHDTGVLWSSVGVDWPVEEPIVSARDAAFPALAEFDSPFVYLGK